MAVVIAAICFMTSGVNIYASEWYTPLIRAEVPEKEAKISKLIEDGMLTQEEFDFYLEYGFYIKDVCSKYDDIDPILIASIIETESWFTPDIENASHHVGLMQVSRKWSKPYMKKLGCTDLLDPFQNILVGVDMFDAWLQMADGNIELALMCYNQGYESAIASYRKGVSTYAKTILERTERLHEVEESFKK